MQPQSSLHLAGERPSVRGCQEDRFSQAEAVSDPLGALGPWIDLDPGLGTITADDLEDCGDSSACTEAASGRYRQSQPDLNGQHGQYSKDGRRDRQSMQCRQSRRGYACEGICRAAEQVLAELGPLLLARLRQGDKGTNTR
jgi:hypothetical protein